MPSPGLTAYEAVVVDWSAIVGGGTGRCPQCHEPGFTVKRIASGKLEEWCKKGCKPADIRDAVRAELIVRRDAAAPKNGAEPVEPPEDITENETSGVSVVNANASKTPKMPQTLEPEAYHGLPGRVMRTIAPHTESHPAGILGSFLTAGGCLIGSRPHVYRDGQQHACNEFALLLGKTGSGRKGSATRRVDELWKYISYNDSTNMAFHDPHAREGGDLWRRIRVLGLGSGEALVADLAEEDEGEFEPRRMVFESEFARCLKVMAREGSTLSDVIKTAWDSEPMQVRTKGKTLRAGRSHVSLLAHSTEADIKERLSQAELFNGFANRFLWLATAQVQSLPFGGGEAPLASLVFAVQQGLTHAAHLGRTEFDADARRLWESETRDGFGVYDSFGHAAGLLGAVTDRGAAHVTRIALQYAVWDLSSEIRVPHLLAGLAVWDYSERTCAAFFGRSTGDSTADTILERLREVQPGYLTRKDIRDLFQRNAPPGRIPAALDLLEELQLIERKKIETGGAPAEIVAVKRAVLNDRYDISPLEAARRGAKELGYTADTTRTTEG